VSVDCWVTLLSVMYRPTAHIQAGACRPTYKRFIKTLKSGKFYIKLRFLKSLFVTSKNLKVSIWKVAYKATDDRWSNVKKRRNYIAVIVIDILIDSLLMEADIKCDTLPLPRLPSLTPSCFPPHSSAPLPSPTTSLPPPPPPLGVSGWVPAEVDSGVSPRTFLKTS
jgi:hypothetical protein